PKLAEAQVPPQARGVERQQLRRAVEDAFVGSFRVVSLTACGLGLLSALCAGLTIRPPPR
ncbi:MAG TPA: hypothetical protein VE091_00095, partial [Gemmatimonadales bacterium]|nr:hypothetical protein [Gemmatimonadales bacterium]